MNTRKITGMAVMTALSLVLVAIPFLRFIPFPIAPFLEYDAADIPIFLATFLYGPAAGLIVTFIVSFLQGFALSSSGIIGVLMHICATGTFVLTGGILFKYLKRTKLNNILSVSISVTVGILGWMISMILYNIIFTPLFMSAPLEDVLPLMLPAIIPFNAIKAGINGVIGGMLYLILYPLISRYIEKSPIVTISDDQNIDKSKANIQPNSNSNTDSLSINSKKQ